MVRRIRQGDTAEFELFAQRYASKIYGLAMNDSNRLSLKSCSIRRSTFQQPIMFAACLDIGGVYAGAVVGAMNTAAQIGSFVSSLMFGYLVDRYGSYNAPFIPMAGLLLIGAWLWVKVNPAEQLVSGMQAVTQTVAVHAGVE